VQRERPAVIFQGRRRRWARPLTRSSVGERVPRHRAPRPELRGLLALLRLGRLVVRIELVRAVVARGLAVAASLAAALIRRVVRIQLVGAVVLRSTRSIASRRRRFRHLEPPYLEVVLESSAVKAASRSGSASGSAPTPQLHLRLSAACSLPGGATARPRHPPQEPPVGSATADAPDAACRPSPPRSAWLPPRRPGYRPASCPRARGSEHAAPPAPAHRPPRSTAPGQPTSATSGS